METQVAWLCAHMFFLISIKTPIFCNVFRDEILTSRSHDISAGESCTQFLESLFGTEFVPAVSVIYNFPPTEQERNVDLPGDRVLNITRCGQTIF